MNHLFIGNSESFFVGYDNLYMPISLAVSKLIISVGLG